MKELTSRTIAMARWNVARLALLVLVVLAALMGHIEAERKSGAALVQSDKVALRNLLATRSRKKRRILGDDDDDKDSKKSKDKDDDDDKDDDKDSKKSKDKDDDDDDDDDKDSKTSKVRNC